jgi:hypothetical protein
MQAQRCADRAVMSLRRTAFALVAALGADLVAIPATFATETSEPATVEPLNRQPWMNVFRRYDSDEKKLFAFYTEAVGFERLETYGAVHRFRAGASEFKLTARTPNRQYVDGGIGDATGLRLITVYYPDAAAVTERFTAHGYAAPQFRPIPRTTRQVALVEDPDGQWLQLIAAPGESEDFYQQVEVGLSVSEIGASRAFYREFVGLEELPPVEDPILGTTKYSYRHGFTTISLMKLGEGLPADTGSGGIQYVISDVEAVERMAKARKVTIEQPLSPVAGYQLRTIWLDDPDGITNYFAQVGAQPGVTPAAPRQ